MQPQDVFQLAQGRFIGGRAGGVDAVEEGRAYVVDHQHENFFFAVDMPVQGGFAQPDKFSERGDFDRFETARSQDVLGRVEYLTETGA